MLLRMQLHDGTFQLLQLHSQIYLEINLLTIFSLAKLESHLAPDGKMENEG